MEYTIPQPTIAYALFRALPIVVLVFLLLNNIQRFAKTGWNKKRFATFYLALFAGALFVVSLVFLRFRIPDIFLVPVGIAVPVSLVILRKVFFPFRLRCTKCNSRLSLRVVFLGVDDVCGDCSRPQDSGTSPS